MTCTTPVSETSSVPSRRGAAPLPVAASADMHAVEASTVTASERRSDIDWLRVVAVLLLIPFHAARIFDVYEPFYAKNAETSWALSYLITFLNVWQMPLLFVLAGASTWFALRKRTPASPQATSRPGSVEPTSPSRRCATSTPGAGWLPCSASDTAICRPHLRRCGTPVKRATRSTCGTRQS